MKYKRYHEGSFSASLRQFPYLKTLQLTSWSWSYFSSNMVLISLYIKRHNKGKEIICKYVNQRCCAYSRAKCGIEKKCAPNVHHSATKCADLLFLFFEMTANKTEKLQNLNCKIDRDVYCCSFKICDFQNPQFPLEVPPVGNLGHLTTFYPFLTTFPSSRFLQVQKLSHIFCLLGVGKSVPEWFINTRF